MRKMLSAMQSVPEAVTLRRATTASGMIWLVTVARKHRVTVSRGSCWRTSGSLGCWAHRAGVCGGGGWEHEPSCCWATLPGATTSPTTAWVLSHNRKLSSGCLSTGKPARQWHIPHHLDYSSTREGLPHIHRSPWLLKLPSVSMGPPFSSPWGVPPLGPRWNLQMPWASSSELTGEAFQGILSRNWEDTEWPWAP